MGSLRFEDVSERTPRIRHLFGTPNLVQTCVTASAKLDVGIPSLVVIRSEARDPQVTVAGSLSGG